MWWSVVAIDGNALGKQGGCPQDADEKWEEFLHNQWFSLPREVEQQEKASEYASSHSVKVTMSA